MLIIDKWRRRKERKVMGHLLSNYYPKFSLCLFTETVSRPNTADLGRVAWKISRGFNRYSLHCSSSLTSTSSPDQKDELLIENFAKGTEDGSGCLGDEKIGWKVRRLAETNDEIRQAVKVQAEAFHQPLALFDDFFFQFFQAEVLAGLLYKLRNSPENRYACLVAEGDDDGNGTAGTGGKVVVGVVDVTVQREESVLRYLPSEVDEYVYVSGIAVSPAFRRQKVGTALLKECDVVCLVWGHKCVVLRAYEDDMGARDLYAKAGFAVVSGDPPWFTTWLGRKRRLLMIKTL